MLWLELFPDTSTKVAISSADIPYITESVMNLYSLGIHEGTSTACSRTCGRRATISASRSNWLTWTL